MPFGVKTRVGPRNHLVPIKIKVIKKIARRDQKIIKQVHSKSSWLKMLSYWCGDAGVAADYIQLTTSLLSIFYTTATLPHQVRVLKPKDKQIKTLSMASVALIIWRSFMVGSRMPAFILFALLFHYWLFVIVGFHYCLMFAVVYNQMRLSKLELSKRVVYTVVTSPNRAWYIMPGCVAVIVVRSRWQWMLRTSATESRAPIKAEAYLAPTRVLVIVTTLSPNIITEQQYAVARLAFYG